MRFNIIVSTYNPLTQLKYNFYDKNNYLNINYLCLNFGAIKT